jgi:hypothetical protein
MQDSNQTEFEDIDTEVIDYGEIEYDNITDTIDMLYYNVVVPFQSGNILVSNPDIIPYMTRSDFIKWIIDNNDYVANFIK